jgi:hypothetical protein
MALSPETRAELASGLRQKLERRYRKATDGGAPGAADPKAALAEIVRALSAELDTEERRCRALGDVGAAETFRAMRDELLPSIAARMLSSEA